MNQHDTPLPPDQNSPPPSRKKKPTFIWESVLSSVPLAPGVYWFIDENSQVLYVGKAKKLKNRLSSYTRFGQLSGKIQQMVATAKDVKFKVLESELQALLLEAELIGTYQPEYNTLLKDDKSPLYIQITKEEYPRVLKIRKKELLKKGAAWSAVLGPFPSAYKTNEVLSIARKIFPWCNESKKNTGKPCFYYHLHLCPGACIGNFSREKYQENITHLVDFLKGKKSVVVASLQEKMQDAVAKQEYEQAGIIRDQLKLIAEFTSQNYTLKPELTTAALQGKISQDGIIYLQKILSEYLGFPKQLPLTTIEGYDVSNIQGTSPAVSLVTFTNGVSDPQNYKVFNIKTLNTPNDFYMLQEALLRRQNHPEWGTPSLLLIDGGKGQVRAVLKIWKWSTPVIGIAKNPDRLVLPYTNETEPGKIKYHLVKLDASHPTLKLIQQIRDEAHRFAQKQHKKRRLKAFFE